MNRGVRRMFVVVLGLFVVLLAATARWTVLQAGELASNNLNRRPQLETARVPRGTIRAADGTLLARSIRQPDGTYQRHYTPAAKQASQLIGYAYTNQGLSGLEKQYQDDLTGKVSSAATLLSALRGNERGNDIVATLNPAVQRAGLEGIAGRIGAAVAIDTRTGGILAMISTPNFDPNDFAANATARRATNASGSPTLNKATQGLFAPGSTMKVVTTAAALASGKYTPTTIVDGSSPLMAASQPLVNFHGEKFGKITLTDALTHSVNTAFGRVAQDLGPQPIAQAMRDFSFGKRLPIAYPNDKLVRSGVRAHGTGEIIPVDAGVDIARVAIGQERLSVTPLQMAFVAATIARGGDKPRLATVERVLDSDGRTVSSLGDGRSAGRAMSRRDAAELTGMMEKVVQEGTGTAAALSGLRVAGKTGSAEVDQQRDLTDPWFIGFAPADNPRVAVAVVLSRLQGATGGVDAAPIARAMMQAAL
ncbi:MAG: penicillin-binding protein 2 [Patulibacter sp.]